MELSRLIPPLISELFHVANSPNSRLSGPSRAALIPIVASDLSYLASNLSSLSPPTSCPGLDGTSHTLPSTGRHLPHIVFDWTATMVLCQLHPPPRGATGAGRRMRITSDRSSSPSCVLVVVVTVTAVRGVSTPPGGQPSRSPIDLWSLTQHVTA